MIWDNLEIPLRPDYEASQKPVPEKRPKRCHRLTKTKTLHTRLDLGQMSVKGLMAWIRSNGIPIVKGQASRAKTLLPQADKIWDAIHNGTMAGKPKPIKVPQVREDLERMDYENLARWLRSQSHPVPAIWNKKEVVRRAEEFWDPQK